ncbi:MAG: hypothetical protein V4515_04555 [Chloroflexota bacterium]
MAKETGLGWTTFAVDNAAGSAQNIRNDVNSLEFATPRAILETTGLDVSAFERLLALADFTVSANGTFNDASNMSHAVLSTVPSTSVARTTTITVSGQTLAGELLYSDYALSRGDDGSLKWTTSGSLADGVVPTWA